MRELSSLGHATPSRAFVHTPPFVATRASSSAAQSNFSAACDRGRWQQQPPNLSADSGGAEIPRGRVMLPPSQSLYRSAKYDLDEEVSAQAAVRPRRYSSLRNSAAAVSEPPFNVGPRLNRPQPSAPAGAGQSRREQQLRRPNMEEFNAAVAMKDGTFEWFLHKDISVITYQNIRYEGKLWSIDKANATIELQNGELF